MVRNSADVFTRLAQRWDDDVSYQRRPVEWVRDKTEEYLWEAQRRIIESVRDNRYTAVPSAHDLGKLLRLDEPLPTPTGWVLNGDVRVGDELLDEQGLPCRVTALSAVQTQHSYRLTFDDRTSIECGADHQWTVLDLRRRKSHTRVADWREQWDTATTMTAQQLSEAGARTSGGQLRWRVPTTKPLVMPNAELPLDPYVLGVWLADGTCGTSTVSLNDTTKQAVAKQLRHSWPSARFQPSRDAGDGHGTALALPGLLPLLRDLGVHRDKHVPTTYLRASYAQRLDLLRGILDGDGFRLENSGSVGIDLTDEVLTDDVHELALTMGWKVYRSEGAAAYTLNGQRHVTGLRYRLNWRPDVDCFAERDPRPVDNAAAQASRHTQRTITAITEIEPVPMRCLTVDSPRHLFLAGRAMVPTHNSHIGSRTIGWWNDTHAPGDSFVVSTAPTAAQVSAILWREVAKVHRLAKLRGRINRAGYPQWYEGAELVGYGRKPADYEESAFQGIHALHVLIVIDEAGGVARHLFDAVDALATNEYARVLAIGNPDDPGSHFASICKPGSGWNVIQLDGLRSPNMSAAQILGSTASGNGPMAPRYPCVAALMRAEGIEFDTEPVPPNLRPYLISPLWVEERIKRWCGVTDAHVAEMDVEELGDLIRRRADGSPLFQAKVRGIFPTSTATGVIPLGWVQQAMNRWKDWSDGDRARGIEPADITRMSRPTDRIVGVDVAYGGQDETCIAIRHGNIITELNRYRHADTTETADIAAQHLHEPGTMAVVDVIGIGAGVYDTLRRYRREGIPNPQGKGMMVEPGVLGRSIPFNAAANSPRTDKIGEFKFRNDRAAAWWKFREAIDPSRGSTMMIPDDERLLEELTAVKYKHLAGGIIQIESKDDIRKRLGRSTDSADAVIQAFWPDGLTREGLTAGDATPAANKAQRKAERRAAVVNYSDEYEPFDEADYEVGGHSSTLG